MGEAAIEEDMLDSVGMIVYEAGKAPKAGMLEDTVDSEQHMVARDKVPSVGTPGMVGTVAMEEDTEGSQTS